MLRRLALAMALALPIASAAIATERSSAISVADAFARETVGSGTTGAAYLTIENDGAAADRLIAAATPFAETAELHTHSMDGGVMRMRRVQAIEVPAKGKAVLAPGGDHVMLFGLRMPLMPDTSFPLTLTFETAGGVTVDVVVVGLGESLGTAGEGMTHGGQMDHGDTHPGKGGHAGQ